MTVSELTDAQRKELVDAATDAISERLHAGAGTSTAVRHHDPILREPGASFVTLQRDDVLLGCIGTLEPVRPLVADVAHNAVAAAFADPRLPSVTRDDYEVMSIELSLLGPLEPIDASSINELARALRPGIDGVALEAPRARATFLPAVWRHFGGDREAFLAALWHKAGLPAGVWPRDTQCSRYAVEKVVDPGPRSAP